MAEGQGSSMFQADQDKEQVKITKNEITKEKKSPFCESCLEEPLPVPKRRFQQERRFQSKGWLKFERLFGPERRFEPGRWFELERWFEPEFWFEHKFWFELERRFVERWLKECVAVFLCSECEMYVCVNCLPRHNSHKGVRVGRNESEGEGRETSESERKLRLLWDDVMRESETESIEKFERSHVSIYDRVYVQHELDEKVCFISGLCVLENQRWVACDYHNHCIKIFTSGSNVLQRYIRFVGSALFGPWDVTEILVDQNSTEPNLASGSSSGVSIRDRTELKKQCLIAVTLPSKDQIMFIDLSKKPALILKVIHTKRECWSIQFNEDKIFTTCREGRFDSSWSVYIYSTDGRTLNKFNTGMYGHFPDSRLAVVSGLVYLTDRDNNKVQRRNVEGQVLSEIRIEGSKPTGISVDPDNNVYVCASPWDQNKVYKLDADLTRYESVLDQTADYIEKPQAMCYHRDKLFISHVYGSSLQNFVTVVRML